MNRNLLLIAIAAIVVVGVGAGILLLGNGQSPGSLSGALAPTSLTLNITPCTEPTVPPRTAGALDFTLSGTLRDANGNPVPGRTVLFAKSGVTVEHAAFMEPPGQSGSAVTAADGSFSLQKQELPTPNYDAGAYTQYQAAFEGDAQFAGSWSNRVTRLC